jgi:hypothetical protein
VIASWVTNDGAWYAPPSTSTDDEVLGTFGLWLHGHSKSTKTKLLELYPLEDFTHLVRLDYDGLLSPQYYRAAQMNRDLWFTCPVLDFAWQYVKNGGGDLSNVRLYEHNATRFTPVYEKMGVPMWRVAHLSDIPYVLNVQNLQGGADNSAAQLELSKTVSRSIAKFVNTGNPEGEGSGVEDWPSAFYDATKKDLRKEFPDSISLELFGGPYGTQPVTVKKGGDKNDASDTEKALYWAKLFERCEFINSEKVREESGV